MIHRVNISPIAWAFPVFFYFTPFQQQLLHKAFCDNLKLSYGLSHWSDHFFFSLTDEYTLLDRLYIYTGGVLRWRL